MYFDDVIEKNKNLFFEITNKKGDHRKFFIKDAVLFRINEEIANDASAYWKGKHEIKGFDFDYSHPPYENMFVQVSSKAGMWIVQEKNKIARILHLFSFDIVLDGVIDKMEGKNALNPEFLSIAKDLENKRLVPRYNKISFSQTDLAHDHPGYKTGYFEIAGGVILQEVFDAEVPKWLISTTSKHYENCLSILRILCLLNCANIKTLKHYSPEKTTKKRIKRGRLPLVSFYTLYINLNKHKTIANSNKQSLSHNRVHLCRGHFKHYTEDKPLFGKFSGLWWWQPTARGRNKKAVIVKDYALC